MAVHAAYSVLILPLHREALTFYLWLRHMKELEQERDALLDGLQLTERAREWYRDRLLETEQQRQLQCAEDPPPPLLGSSLLVQIQEVNRILSDLMTSSEKVPLTLLPYRNPLCETPSYPITGRHR
ncbi:suppressor APC domain-containing protein 1 isoform X2 [Ascaphus truei]|uniref:suppressor APC domain-containing protein 1 isoform X2 n=1 Tax=Ascaphus truei TaxID=8439 RepID=UPI003F5A4A6A